MAKLVIAVLALLAVGAAAQAAPKTTDLNGALTKAGFTKFAALLDIANVTAPASNPKAKVTFLAPSDAAVDAFLKSMGLTVADLKAHPKLAKKIAAYHLLLRSNVRPAEIFADGNTRVATTAARRPNDLIFTKDAAGKVTVTDVQGNVANVGKPVVVDENKTVLPVDKVLMSSDYYTGFDSLCKQRALTISDFCRALAYSGAAPALAGAAATVFVPTNAAFAKAKVALGAGKPPKPADVAALLKAHVVADAAKTELKSFKGGKEAATLAGPAIKVEYTKQPGDALRKLPSATAEVVSSDGTRAKVLKSDVYVGKALVQGIDAVLTPAAKPAAAAATTTKPAAAPAAAAATKPAGRRLLDFGWGMSGGPTAEMDDAESAIDNAVAGNESVAAASDQSLLGAEELSVPGDYNQVDNGVNPW